MKHVCISALPLAGIVVPGGKMRSYADAEDIACDLIAQLQRHRGIPFGLFVLSDGRVTAVRAGTPEFTLLSSIYTDSLAGVYDDSANPRAVANDLLAIEHFSNA